MRDSYLHQDSFLPDDSKAHREGGAASNLHKGIILDRNHPEFLNCFSLLFELPLLALLSSYFPVTKLAEVVEAECRGIGRRRPPGRSSPHTPAGWGLSLCLSPKELIPCNAESNSFPQRFWKKPSALPAPCLHTDCQQLVSCPTPWHSTTANYMPGRW